MNKSEPLDINTILQRQRSGILDALGLAEHPLVLDAYAHNLFPDWEQFIEVDISDAKKDKLADALYTGDPEKRSPVLLRVSDYSRGIAERILQRCADDGVDVIVQVDDPVFMRRVLLAGGEEAAAQYGALTAKPREKVARVIGFNMNTPHFVFPDAYPEALVEIHDKAVAERRKSHSPDLFFTVTRIPAPEMADIDGLDYEELLRLYFNMIDVDMHEMDKAHRVLIDMLDNASHIRFTNNDGTDVSMGINGFTFANSLTAKNVPGSEVFSAPERLSVQGKLVAKGRFIPPHTHKVIEDITLEFKDGRVVDHHAETGHDVLTEFLNTDEDARYVGEVALGTNPALRRHITNSLMVEKVGLSFHIALGRSYTFTDYLGTPVHVNNGNASARHWDITTMLFGKEGRIIVDGESIMENGFYLDPRLAYLNSPVV